VGGSVNIETRLRAGRSGFISR